MNSEGSSMDKKEKSDYARKYPKRLFSDEYLNHLASLEEDLHEKIDNNDKNTKTLSAKASKISYIGNVFVIVGVAGFVSSLALSFLGVSQGVNNLVVLVSSLLSISGQILFMYATRIQYKIAKDVAETMNEYKQIRLEQDKVVSKINYQQSDGAC